MMWLISLIVVIVIVVISLFFYHQFRQALDERMLLQLSSIMHLKSLQIEDYVQTQLKQFDQLEPPLLSAFDDYQVNNLDSVCIGEIIGAEHTPKLYDLSWCSLNKSVLLGVVKHDEQGVRLHLLNHKTIQEILLERTGMGESGETYLVGADHTMRSLSRFFPDEHPLNLPAATDGVLQALSGRQGSGIIKDYREVPVYSAFRKLNIPGIDWVILSEIDVEEVTIPLSRMRNKLILISIAVCLMAIVLSLLVTNLLTRPLFRMRDLLRRMSLGKFDLVSTPYYQTVEIHEMFTALDELRKSINQAIQYSSEIGNMNLSAQYQLSGQHDELGKSLIRMKSQLAEYKRHEKTSHQVAKRSLITGQENERKRLAREMHDGLGPLLTSLKLTIQALDLDSIQRKKVNGLIDHTIAEIRRVTYDLMPPALLDFGVGRAMLHFVEMIRKSSELEIRYDDSTKESGSAISPEMNICLFRVCQELLHNAIKHSGATRVALSITEFDEKVSLYYSDNGRGFDTDKPGSGSGLKNIEERIAVFDGYMHIASSDNGTTVEIELPIL